MKLLGIWTYLFLLVTLLLVLGPSSQQFPQLGPSSPHFNLSGTVLTSWTIKYGYVSYLMTAVGND